MTPEVEERPITQRVPERPSLKLSQIREVKPRELGIRFVAGATTSVVAGLVTLGFGPRIGGIFLAFPAILAASLTLIEQEEGTAEAREDARGAVSGGLAMALFAAIAAIAFGHLSAVLALVWAAVGWFLGAVGGYLAAWFS